jgi:hypothetical protein
MRLTLPSVGRDPDLRREAGRAIGLPRFSFVHDDRILHPRDVVEQCQTAGLEHVPLMNHGLLRHIGFQECRLMTMSVYEG